jgi:flavin reductase (DIM6/NTAB) family NADH-FMN oxidoreductase RutF
MVGEKLKEAMNLSSGTYPPEVDEFELAGLTKAPGIAIAAPHVAEAPAVLECRAVKIVDDLPNRNAHTFNIVVIGEVVGVRIDDAVLKDGRVDVLAFNPVARLGYMDYTTVTEVWEMQRPA